MTVSISCGIYSYVIDFCALSAETAGPGSFELGTGRYPNCTRCAWKADLIQRTRWIVRRLSGNGLALCKGRSLSIETLFLLFNGFVPGLTLLPAN